MKILALEREKEGATAAQFHPHLAAEAAQVYDLYRQGIVREFYFDQNRHTAVLMLECPDAEEARQALDKLPLVEQGLITFDLISLQPYDGFSRLFRN